MATEVVHTIRASGGDYTTLSAWEAAQQRDLVAVDEIAVAECYNDWPTGLSDQVVVSGWTTSASNNVIIRAAAGQSHNGDPESGFTLVFNTNGYVCNLPNPYSIIDGVAISTSLSTYTYSYGLYVGVNCRASNCIVKGASSKLHHGIRCGLGAGGNLTIAPRVESSIVTDAKNLGISSNAGGAFHGAIADNCTVVNCGIAFKTANNELRLRNCVAYNNTSNYPDAYHTDSTNNAASDGSTNTPPGSNPLTVDITSADFVDAANGDFSLSAGSQLINAGADLSSDFTTDIVGTVRG